MKKKTSKLKWNLLDGFIIGLVILTGLAVYFTFFKPISFSETIQKEGVYRYAKVDILLPDDLSWMEMALPEGEESRNVYGKIDWKVESVRAIYLNDKKITQVSAYLLVTLESSGIIRYGKYTLVRGGLIRLINDAYFVEGRVLNWNVEEEKVLL